jgi:hypothetical protein
MAFMHRHYGSKRPPRHTRPPPLASGGRNTRVTGLSKDLVSTCLNARSVSAMCDACSLSGDAGEARVAVDSHKEERAHVRIVGVFRGLQVRRMRRFIITLDALCAGDFSVALDSTHGGSPCRVRSPPCSALSAAQQFICRVMHARLRIWGRHGVNAADVRQTACGVCTVVRFTF